MNAISLAHACVFSNIKMNPCGNLLESCSQAAEVERLGFTFLNVLYNFFHNCPGQEVTTSSQHPLRMKGNKPPAKWGSVTITGM